MTEPTTSESILSALERYEAAVDSRNATTGHDGAGVIAARALQLKLARENLASTIGGLIDSAVHAAHRS